MLLNIDEAIKAHAAWKMKLTSYLRSPDGSIDKDKLAKDNVCALGEWLYSNNPDILKLPEYKDLVKTHADFHKEASNIVIKADKGIDISADVLLGAKSLYSAISEKIVKILMDIKNREQN